MDLTYTFSLGRFLQKTRWNGLFYLIKERTVGFFDRISKIRGVKEILNLFVYGSLKLGECNERMLKKWVVSSSPATTRGFMHLRPDRYPALFLPTHGPLGTPDYQADLTLSRAPLSEQGHEVVGQLLQLESGCEMLRRLDEFEGYFPGRRSEYLRVAVSVETPEGAKPCWTYTGVEAPPSEWPLISQWPPKDLAMTPDPYRHGL